MDDIFQELLFCTEKDFLSLISNSKQSHTFYTIPYAPQQRPGCSKKDAVLSYESGYCIMNLRLLRVRNGITCDIWNFESKGSNC
jgi:hypothetical protein